MSNNSQPVNSGGASGRDLRVKVLHLLGGQTFKGGTCTFAIQLTRQRLPGIEQLIWMRRGFVPEETDLPLVRGGRVSRVPASLWEDLLGGIVEAWPLKCWVANHRPVILHAHSRMGMVAGALASKLTGVPLVLNFHFRARHRRVYQWLRSWTNAAPVYNSRGTCEHYGGDPNQALIVMPPILWPSTPPLESGPPIRFVMAGTYVRWKNPHLVIDAFNRLTAQGAEAQLVIYGRMDKPFDPVYEAEIVRLARTNPRIVLKAYDPAWLSHLSGTDIFVHAAQEEPFGIVILEAFARGCRMVVPPGTFLDELPEPCRSAGICRLDRLEVSEAAAAMERALKQKVDAAAVWEQRKALRSRFDLASCARSLQALYESLARPASSEAHRS